MFGIYIYIHIYARHGKPIRLEYDDILCIVGYTRHGTLIRRRRDIRGLSDTHAMDTKTRKG